MRACMIAAFCLVLLFTGCKRTRFKVVPVEGKIAFTDGRALPTGTRLNFTPGEGGVGAASAVIGADGAFKVTHEGGDSGAEIGKYVVLLSPPKDDKTFYKIVPGEYYDGGVLAVEVTEGMAPLDLRVKTVRRR